MLYKVTGDSGSSELLAWDMDDMVQKLAPIALGELPMRVLNSKTLFVLGKKIYALEVFDWPFPDGGINQIFLVDSAWTKFIDAVYEAGKRLVPEPKKVEASPKSTAPWYRLDCVDGAMIEGGPVEETHLSKILDWLVGRGLTGPYVQRKEGAWPGSEVKEPEFLWTASNFTTSFRLVNRKFVGSTESDYPLTWAQLRYLNQLWENRMEEGVVHEKKEEKLETLPKPYRVEVIDRTGGRGIQIKNSLKEVVHFLDSCGLDGPYQRTANQPDAPVDYACMWALQGGSGEVAFELSKWQGPDSLNGGKWVPVTLPDIKELNQVWQTTSKIEPEPAPAKPIYRLEMGDNWEVQHTATELQDIAVALQLNGALPPYSCKGFGLACNGFGVGGKLEILFYVDCGDKKLRQATPAEAIKLNAVAASEWAKPLGEDTVDHLWVALQNIFTDPRKANYWHWDQKKMDALYNAYLDRYGKGKTNNPGE